MEARAAAVSVVAKVTQPPSARVTAHIVYGWFNRVAWVRPCWAKQMVNGRAKQWCLSERPFRLPALACPPLGLSGYAETSTPSVPP